MSRNTLSKAAKRKSAKDLKKAAAEQDKASQGSDTVQQGGTAQVPIDIPSSSSEGAVVEAKGSKRSVSTTKVPVAKKTKPIEPTLAPVDTVAPLLGDIVQVQAKSAAVKAKPRARRTASSDDDFIPSGSAPSSSAPTSSAHSQELDAETEVTGAAHESEQADSDSPPVADRRKRGSTTSRAPRRLLQSLPSFGDAVEDDLDAHVDETLDALRPGAAYKDQNLSTVARIDALIKQAKLARHGEPTAAEQLQKNFKQLMETSSRAKSTSDRWAAALRRQDAKQFRKGDPLFSLTTRNNEPVIMIELKRGKDHVRFQLQVEEVRHVDVNDRSTALKILTAVEDLVNAWTPIYGAPKSFPLRKMLFSAATEYAVGGIISIRDTLWRKQDGFRTSYHFINEDTGLEDEWISYVTQGFTATHGEVHIPSNAEFHYGDVNGAKTKLVPKYVDQNGVTNWESRLPTDRDPLLDSCLAKAAKKPTIEELRNREHFIRWTLWTTRGIRTTQKKLEALIDNLILQHGGLAQRRRQMPRHSTMPTIPGFATLLLSRSPGKVYFRATNLVIKALGLPSTSLALIATKDGRILGPILDAINDVFSKAFDVDSAALVMARTIDAAHAMIDSGIEPDDPCNCSEEQRQHIKHACNRCLIAHLCNDLTANADGFRLCSACSGLATTYAEDFSLLIEKLLISNLAPDLRASGLAEQRSAGIVAACRELLIAAQKDVTGLQFNDAYDGVQTRKSTRSPFSASVEAVMPFGRLSDSTLLRHTPDNVATVSDCLNLAHYNHHVGSLQVMADYLRSAKTAADQAQLMSRLETLQQVMYGIGTPNAWRRKKLSASQYNSLRQAWVAAALPDHRQMNKAQRNPRNILAQTASRTTFRRCPWTVKERDQWVKICREIVKRYGTHHSLDISGDGSPWFLQLGDRPDWWMWDACFEFFAQRLERLAGYCNVKWYTIESEATVMLELCYQLNTTDKAYQSLLGLPMVLWASHPLCVSYGHRHHGAQMRTGWSLNPKSLEDRDDSLNNLLIETMTENKLKFNYKESDYPAIRGLMHKVQIPKAYYNPEQGATTAAHAIILDDESPLVNQYDVPDVIFDDDLAEEDEMASPKEGPATESASKPAPAAKTSFAKSTDTAPAAADTTSAAILRAYLDHDPEFLQIQRHAQLPFAVALDNLAVYYSNIGGKDFTAGARRSNQPHEFDNSNNELLPSYDDIRCFDGPDDWGTDAIINFSISSAIGPGDVPDKVYVASDMHDVSRYIGMRPRYADESVLESIEQNKVRVLEGDPNHISYPFADVKPGQTEAITAWQSGERHFVVAHYIVDDEKKSGRVQCHDSQPIQPGAYTYDYYVAGLRAMVLIGSYASMNPEHPWFGYIWEGSAELMPTQRQTGGDCAFHAIHNVVELATTGALPVKTTIPTASTILDQDYRWEALCHIYRRLLHADANTATAPRTGTLGRTGRTVSFAADVLPEGEPSPTKQRRVVDTYVSMEDSDPSSPREMFSDEVESIPDEAMGFADDAPAGVKQTTSGADKPVEATVTGQFNAPTGIALELANNLRDIMKELGLCLSKTNNHTLLARIGAHLQTVIGLHAQTVNAVVSKSGTDKYHIEVDIGKWWGIVIDLKTQAEAQG